MKVITATIFMLVASVLVNDIAKINRLKSDAREAYQRGDYREALHSYQILVDSFGVQEEEIIMNLANSAYLLASPGNSAVKGLEGPSNSKAAPNSDHLQLAQSNYTFLSQNASTTLRSLAYNQLGVMAYQQGEAQPTAELLQSAQAFFKEALKKNSNNEDARYNYELVTKMLDQQQDQQDQNNDQEQQDQNQEQDQQQQQENQSQEQEQESAEDQQEDQNGQENPQQSEEQPGESPQQQQESQQSEEQQEQQSQNQPSEPSQVEEMKISEEKARMILEAMKNAEIQYIQQNKRKATKRPESGKPDW